MKTKTYNVYSFAELSGPACQRAIDAHRQFIAEQWDGETVIEDAQRVLAFAGLTVDKVFYSGFSSQGDGACFEGSWHASGVRPDLMRAECPVDSVLHRIADGFAKLAALYPNASFTVKHSGHYYHQYCTEFCVSIVDANCDEIADTGTAEADLIELARDAMEWIYRQLEKEYDYQTAEAQVVESIEANDYEFTKDGRID